MAQVPSPRSTLADDAALDSEAAASCARSVAAAPARESAAERARSVAAAPCPEAPLQRANAAAQSFEDRLQLALDLGYRHLGKRDRTEAELRRHLAAREVDEVSIDGAIEALVRQGYLDDARYARVFAEDRRALDDWGPDRIERRLLELGVAPELVAGAVSARDAAGEFDAAVALLRRRFGALAESDRDRDRALRMLARKGYDLELAHDAVRAFAGDGA
jgi:regulatory protein